MGLKRLSSAVAWEFSKPVFSRWHSWQSAWKLWICPRNAVLTGTTWSNSQVPSATGAPQSLHAPPCEARICSRCCGTSAGYVPLSIAMKRQIKVLEVRQVVPFAEPYWW